MTVAFAKAEDQSNWIRNHSVRTNKFREHGRPQKFVVTDDEFEPDMNICFGYDTATQTFFVSDTVPPILREILVRFECMRLFGKKGAMPHLDAVKKLFEEFGKSRKRALLPILHKFYSALADARENDHNVTEEVEDIRETATYLTTLLEKSL